MTQDIDIVLPAERIEAFLRAAAVSGFQVVPSTSGRWPKVAHKEPGIQVDILPEGQRPGTPPDFAPTTIPRPSALGAAGPTLRFTSLPALIELKLAAGRLKDQADVVELIRANGQQIDNIRERLTRVHAMYLAEFDRLIGQAKRDDVQR